MPCREPHGIDLFHTPGRTDGPGPAARGSGVRQGRVVTSVVSSEVGESREGGNVCNTNKFLL